MAHLTQELMRDMVRGLPRRTSEPKLLCHGEHEISYVQKQMQRWHEECPEKPQTSHTGSAANIL